MGRSLTPRRLVAAAMRLVVAPLLLLATSYPVLADVSEAQVKAAFLCKFGFFIEWPVAAFPSTDAPLTLCVVGTDPFGPALDEIAKSQKVGARPITLRRIPSIARDSGCHIAYIATLSAQTKQDLRGSDVLTVTDAGVDQSQQGIINFVVKDNRVRFDIDDAAAAAGGLNISSRLLTLALNVNPRH
jgi:hypothetical protein